MEANALKPAQRFWRLLKPDRREIRNIYIFAIFSGLISLSLPLGIQAIVNFIQGGQVSTSWIVLVVLVVLGVAAAGILQIYQLRISENLQQKIFTRAAFEFAHRVPRVRLEALYRKYAPELMNRFFDTISVQKGLSKILIDFSTATLHTLFGLILLSFYHPFFLVFSFFLVLLVILIIRLTINLGLATSLQESKHKYSVAHWLQEIGRTSITFKMAGDSDLPLQKTDERVGAYLTARENHFKILVGQYSLMVVFKVIVAIGLLVIGGILVMEQLMNIGQFVAAEIIILLVMNSVEKLVMSFETIYDVLTSLEKIGQVTDLELDEKEGVNLKEQCGNCGLDVKITDLSFRYPNMKNNVVGNINLEMPPNSNTVIVGASASGKSTLLQLVAGLYEFEDGSISYNDIPLRNIQLSSLHCVVGDFLSRDDLFEGTVLENITMNRPGVTMERVRTVVKALHLEAFIASLEDGYETQLVTNGESLPGGIISKLLLARAVVDEPKLLLMENSLEKIEENERNDLIEYLTAKERPWTLIAISRNDEFAKKADQIVLLEKGNVTQKGQFNDLKHLFE